MVRARGGPGDRIPPVLLGAHGARRRLILLLYQSQKCLMPLFRRPKRNEHLTRGGQGKQGHRRIAEARYGDSSLFFFCLFFFILPRIGKNKAQGVYFKGALDELHDTARNSSIYDTTINEYRHIGGRLKRRGATSHTSIGRFSSGDSFRHYSRHISRPQAPPNHIVNCLQRTNKKSYTRI